MFSSAKPGSSRHAVSDLDGLASALRFAMADGDPADRLLTAAPRAPMDAVAADGGDGVEPDGPQFTLSLLTTGTDGWPVTSLLGPGEVVVIDAVRVRIALWSSARANGNLAREERATLDFIFEGCFFQLRLRSMGHAPLVLSKRARADATTSTLVCHELLLVEGEAQRVPYAELTSGIRYRLTGDATARADTAERWRAQQAALAAFSWS
ncbi:hypothetical protein [Robbsia sp. KACC 23696]|uniref:hypothetical protein n=1 Tax=Robbsia sp. KACC 23696 TaxID=3149231 RepID=UPI00325A4EF1